MKKLLTVLFCTIVAFIAPALAHTSLTSSSIKAGAQLDVSPASIELTFGADVGLAVIHLKNSAGDEIALTYEKPKKMQKTFVVPLPSLAPGDYVFHWRTVAKDGHPMNGEIPFSVH